MKRKILSGLIEAVKRLRETADDETAIDAVFAFPEWKPSTAFAVDERIRFGEKLYRCIQAHTSQDGWEPPNTPALWAEVSIDKYPAWVQPNGAADAYHIGDTVSYGGKHWVSTADNNVWTPGVYGWNVMQDDDDGKSESGLLTED